MQEATETFLHYLYYDTMDPRTSAQHVIAVLHVAHYYGAGRLVALCEAFLAKELKRGDKDDEGNFPGLHIVNLMLLQSGQTFGAMTCSSPGATAVLARVLMGTVLWPSSFQVCVWIFCTAHLRWIRPEGHSQQGPEQRRSNFNASLQHQGKYNVLLSVQGLTFSISFALSCMTP